MLLQSTVLFLKYVCFSDHSFMNMILEKKNILQKTFPFFLKLIGIEFKLT